MGTTNGGLTAANWIAIIFGTLSLVISVVALARSLRSERKAEQATLNQKRQELLSLAIEAEIALDSARAPMQKFLEECRAFRRENLFETANDLADHAVDYAQHTIDAYSELREQIRGARLEASKQLPPRKQWTSLSQMIEGFIVSLTPLANKDHLTIEDRKYMDMVKESFHSARSSRQG